MNERLKQFGLFSEYATFKVSHTIECQCGEQLFLEYAREPIINDPCEIIFKCKKCEKIHKTNFKNDAGYHSKNVEILEVNWTDE